MRDDDEASDSAYWSILIPSRNYGGGTKGSPLLYLLEVLLGLPRGSQPLKSGRCGGSRVNK